MDHEERRQRKKEAVRQHALYMEQWKLQNTAARLNPLRPNTVLMGKLTTDIATEPPRPLSSSSGASSPAPIRPKLDLRAEETVISLRLLRSLRASKVDHLPAKLRKLWSADGNGHWSQVWLAEGKNDGTSEELQLAVKLFQESLFPAPDAVDFLRYDSWCARRQSANEAWAFDTLRSLQGSVLPHSYGFWEFHLPCGETVVGHVMEHIDGKALQRDYEAMIDGSFYSPSAREYRQQMLLQLVQNVYCMHSLGVHHGDLFQRNVLQLRTEGTSSFVLIDFSLASSISNRSRYGTIDAVGLWNCLQEIEEGPVLCDWLEDNIARGEDWTAVFTKGRFLERLRESADSIERGYKGQVEHLKEARARRALRVDYRGPEKNQEATSTPIESQQEPF